MRETILTGEILHIYNRGVDKRIIFEDSKDYTRFLHSLTIANYIDYPLSLLLGDLQKGPNLFKILVHRHAYESPLADIIAYTLMPNHYHIIVQQNNPAGIQKLMQKVSNSYTKYFNSKNRRTGSLFEGKYKYTKISTDASLLNTLHYLKNNPNKLNDDKKRNWTSFKQDLLIFGTLPVINYENYAELYEKVDKLNQ